MSARGFRPRLVALLAALTGALCPLVAGAWPADAAAAAIDPPPVTVLVDQIAPSVLRPGQDLTVTATVRNDGTTTIEGATVNLYLNRVRPSTRASLEGWATGSSGASGSRVATAAPGLIEPGAAVSVQLVLAAGDVRLLDQLDVWGPRGLAVEVVGADGRRLDTRRTFLLWQPDEVVPQVRVSVLAAVTGPGRHIADPPSAPTTDQAPAPTAATTATDPAELEELTAPGGRLRAVLDIAVQDRDIELAVDPALVTDAASAGPNARQWAAELVATLAVRESFTLPWSDPDLAALAHADQGDLLTAARVAAVDADLTDSYVRTDVLWAPGDETDTATLGLAASNGAALLVGPGTLQSKGAVTTARADVETPSGTVTALVPDALLTSLFVDPTFVEPGASIAMTVQRMLAELAVLAHDGRRGPHDVLVTFGRDQDLDPELTGALLAALRASPWTRVVPLSTVLGSGDDDARRTAAPAYAPSGQELAPSQVRALAEARARSVEFAAVTDEPAALLAGLDDEVLAPLAVAWRADATGRDRLVEAALDDAAALRTGLSLAPVSNVNLISATAPFRFVVRNDLSVPVTVSVEVRPRKACLRPATSEAVTVPARGETVVPVELHSVANCDVTVDVTLTDTAGMTVAPAVTFSARVAPTIESVGTIVVGVLLAIGLVLGIARTVRRGQSARRGARRVASDDDRPLPVLGGEVAAPAPVLDDEPPAKQPPPDEAVGQERTADGEPGGGPARAGGEDVP